MYPGRETQPTFPPQVTQDLTLVESWYAQTTDRGDKLYLGTNLARTKAIIGLPHLPVLDEVLALSGKGNITRERERAGVYRDAAQIYTWAGDTNKAYEAIAKGAEIDRAFLLPWGYLDIAKIELKQGKKPTDSIAKALKSVKRIGDPLRVCHQYFQVAKLQSRAGVNSRSLVYKAVVMLDEASVAHPQQKLLVYQDATEAYAVNGDFGLAFQTLPKMVAELPSYTRQKRDRSLTYIANELIKAGRFEQALHAVHGIDDYSVIARCNAKVALAQARTGFDPKEWIDTSLEQIEDYQQVIKLDPYAETYRARLSKIFAILGQAEAENGNDSRGRFAQAMDYARKEPSLRQRAELLSEVGSQMAAVGYNPRQAFLEAVVAAELLLSQPENDPRLQGFLHLIGQSIAIEVPTYQDVLEQATNAGLLDLVDRGIDRLYKLDHRLREGFSTLVKADLLLGRVEALVRAA